jgi:DNA-directed RNA polymerase sigma subunit (sigma70/sigma32)
MFIDYRNSSSKLNPRFALYLKDLFNHHKVLSPEVENALITKAKKDDDLEAKNLIILSHCRLYYRVSCKYAFYVQGSISQTEDFFNECFIAANKALDTYQIGRSKFSTWVLFYIKRQFIKYINENSRTITYPVSVYYASKRMENQEKAGKIFKEVDATEYKKSFFEAIFMQNVIFDNNNESSIMYKSIVSENDEKESLKNLDFV